MGQLFGTDGVRGVANSELTPELAFKLGRFGAHVLLQQMHAELGLPMTTDSGVAVTGAPPTRSRVVIGKDTRRSCQMLEAALAAGFCSAGTDVYLAGVIPTPGVAWLTAQNSYDAGVMISASHNAAQFNGIKFFNYAGYKLPDRIEDDIEAYVTGLRGEDLSRPVGAGIGTIYSLDNACKDYVEHLKHEMGSDLSGLRVVLDCANGSAARYAETLFTELGADVVRVIGNDPDGLNINKRCGSTHMFAVSDAVVETGADLGLSFDGDADRLLACTSSGEVVDGDVLLAILSYWMKQQGKLKDNTLVATVMSNYGLRKFCEEHGIHLIQTAVGDRYVLEGMRKQKYTLGGEQSGHTIMLDHSTTGDGMLTALALTRALRDLGRDLSEAASAITIYPQVSVPVPADNKIKHLVLEDPQLKSYLSQVENNLSDGRILVRPSGTEPLIRVMIEGPAEDVIAPLAAEVSEHIRDVARSLGY